MVTVNLGTGVGVGIIVHGSLYRGMTNSAGEWGHTTIVPDGRACRCGNLGCVEAYVGAPGIIRTLREIAPQSVILRAPNQIAIIDALATAAEQNDPDARAVIHSTARFLGIAMANMINMFNPEVVTLGSWVGRRLGPLLLPPTRTIVAQHTLQQTFDAASIQVCRLPNNPISMGAATLALEGYLVTRQPRATRSVTAPTR